jgi:thiol-disulfide isomerase/thioredoxin
MCKLRHFLSHLFTIALILAFIRIDSAECRPTSNAVTPISAKELKNLVRGNSDKKPDQFTLVNVWATWCEPCKIEMPELVQFAASHPTLIQLVLVSADSADDLKSVSVFLNSLKIENPTYRLSEDPEVFAKQFAPQWSATLPVTFVFDSEGRQVTFWVGKINKSELEAKLKAHFKPTLAKTKKI